MITAGRIKGVVLDKYRFTKRTATPSTENGTIRPDEQKEVDYYMIKTPNGIEHILCYLVDSVNAT